MGCCSRHLYLRTFNFHLKKSFVAFLSSFPYTSQGRASDKILIKIYARLILIS